jgi:hypothetical protein
MNRYNIPVYNNLNTARYKPINLIYSDKMGFDGLWHYYFRYKYISNSYLKFGIGLVKFNKK